MRKIGLTGGIGSGKTYVSKVFEKLGFPVSLPEGAFYLWIRSEGKNCWEIVEELSNKVGVLVTPGIFFGETCSNFVRVAAVQEMSKLSLLKERISKLS